MAAGTSVPSSPSPAPNGSRPPSSAKPTSSAKLVEYDRYIESQLQRTRRQVKGVDLMASLMLLAAGSMGYLLLAALVDHWLVPGGMGFAGRFACLALFLAGLTAYVVVRLGPLLLRRINPVYAAQAIEQSRPGLKNSLVNFLMLRSSDALPQRVYEAIEEQAANGLSAAKVETAVDRSPLVKLLTLLMVLVSVVAIYRIVSPKNPFTSIRRVIAPWADISAPTRVAIAEIQPGETEGYHDQHLNVSAMISGLAGSEHPTLHYSTADGQVIDHRVRMTLPETGYRHAAELPADAAGLQQDLEYWITAGDAISPRYKVAVRIAPAIVVDSIEYAYPTYSEQAARSVPQRGDIRALEGTQVTLRATATHVIKSADIDFDCDGGRDLAMKIDGRKATATFTLALKKSSDEPEHESYQLRFRNEAGHENPRPIRYAIEVIPDLPPEIALIEPEVKPTEEIQLAEGASLPLKLTAADPDFKLADVRLHATRGTEPLLDQKLLAEPRVGPFERRFRFSTRSLKLKAGDRVSLWASADDNKQPGANHVETPRYTVRIVSPDGKQEQDQLANNDSNKKPDDKPQQDQPNGKPNPAERQPGDDGQPNDKQQPGDEPQEKGGKDKHDKQQPRDKQPSDKDPSDKQDGQDGGDGAEGDKQSQGKQSAGKKPMGEDQKSDGQNPDDSESQGEGEQGDGQQNGKNRKGSQKSAGGKGSEDNDERVDPEKDPGRAIEEINKFFNDKKNEDKKKDEPSTEKSKPSDDKQQGEKKEPGDQKQPSKGEPSDEKKSQGEPSDGDRSKAGGQDSDKQDGSKQKGKPQGKAASKDESGSQEKGDKPEGADAKSGEKKDSSQAGGEGEGKDAAMPEDSSQGGDEKQGKKQQGAKQPGKQQPGQEKASSKQSAGEDKTDDEKQGEGEKAGKESSDKSAMKDDAQSKEEAQSKDNPGKQESGDQPDGAEEKNAKQGAGEKKQGAGKEPAGDKKPEEDELRPGAGQDVGGEGQDKQPSDKNKPAEQGGNAGKSKSQNETPQEPGDGDASGQDKSKQPGEQGAGDESKMGDDAPKNAEGNRKSQAGKKAGQSKGQGEKKDKQNPDEDDPHKDVAGGDSEGQDKGKAGAGQKGGNNKSPAPSPMEKNKQRDKKLSPDEKAQGNNDEESTSSSVSDHQSDSKSDKSGEHSGGGGKGGGQRSESPGKGSAGQNTDADQGGGQSEQTGKGPKSDKPGDQVKGEKPSGGKPSGEKGPGKSKQAGGSKEGGAEGEPKEDGQAPDDAEKQPADSNQDQEPGGKPTPSDNGGHDLKQKSPSGNGPNNQTGGGVPPPDNPDGPAEPSDMSEPGGDDPNLEYTRKATDLALERLKDQLQKGNPDQELLDKLKWSRKDVEEFVKRWDQLKKSAQTPGAQGDAAREELDETLRSLGLHQRGSSLSGGQKRGDQRRNLIETRRTAPPPEYADQYREFSKGISRAKTK